MSGRGCYVLAHEVHDRIIKVGRGDYVARLNAANNPTAGRPERWRFLLGVDGVRLQEDVLHNFFAPRAEGWGVNREVFGPITDDQYQYLRWLYHEEHVTHRPDTDPRPSTLTRWTPENNAHRLGSAAALVTREQWDLLDRDDDLPQNWWDGIEELPAITPDDWYTPIEMIERAKRVCGDFDLDPASHVYANRRIRALRIFTKDDDGLVRDWSGRVWVNPPFSAWDQFGSKILREWRRGDISHLFTLMPTRALATKQVFEIVSSCNAIFSSYGRYPFWGPFGSNSATDGQIICYFGPRADTFAKAFSDMGIVFVPSPHWAEVPKIKTAKPEHVETNLDVPEIGNKSWGSTVRNA